MLSRSYDLEILDLGNYTVEEYEDCLIKLDRVGRWLGGHAANFKALDRSHPQSILDVGCGGGQFTIAMARQFPQAKVVGLEVNPLAIAFARRHLKELPDAQRNVSFELCPELNQPDDSYDVVIATLVCHHLDDTSLINFLKNAYRVAAKRVIINDLHRHLFALLGFKALSPLFFRNRLVMHDGPLSIKRAFTRKEWVDYLAAAVINNYSIRWHWAFRWLVEIVK